jgi:FkbM family methyltransferase
VATLRRRSFTQCKAALKGALNYCGIDVRMVRRGQLKDAGTDRRPLCDMECFLQDIHRRGFRPRGVLDVGAHRGDWTREALALFPDAAAVMIEPQEEMRPYLERVVRDFPRAEFVLAGAGAEAGELPMELDYDFDGSSFNTQPDAQKLAAGTQRMLPIVTLDSVMATRPSFAPELVKMDVQGFELKALEGAKRLFGVAELFILETHLFQAPGASNPVTREIVAFMFNAGYEFYDVTDFLRRPSDGALGQIDLAFAKADGYLRRSKAW